MKKLNGIEKVAEKGDALANELNAIKLIAEKINSKTLTEKLKGNKSIWKKEILANYKTEKTARKNLRDYMQYPLSKKVVNALNRNDNPALKLHCEDLLKFSKTNLVDIHNFTNVNESTDKGLTIQTAYKTMFLICK